MFMHSGTSGSSEAGVGSITGVGSVTGVESVTGVDSRNGMVDSEVVLLSVGVRLVI